MGGFGGNSQLTLCLRLFWLSVGCLALANCANGNMASRVDPNSISITTTADAEHAQHQNNSAIRIQLKSSSARYFQWSAHCRRR